MALLLLAEIEEKSNIAESFKILEQITTSELRLQRIPLEKQCCQEAEDKVFN